MVPGFEVPLTKAMFLGNFASIRSAGKVAPFVSEGRGLRMANRPAQSERRDPLKPLSFHQCPLSFDRAISC
jgi:hypothetical protein